MSGRRSKHEESAIADYYEQHRDDPEEWGEPEAAPPGTYHQKLGTTVTVRFSAEEAERIRRLAKATGRSNSDIIRRAVRAYEARDAAATA